MHKHWASWLQGLLSTSPEHLWCHAPADLCHARSSRHAQGLAALARYADEPGCRITIARLGCLSPRVNCSPVQNTCGAHGNVSIGLRLRGSAAADPVDTVSSTAAGACGGASGALQLQGALHRAGLVQVCMKRMQQITLRLSLHIGSFDIVAHNSAPPIRPR